MIRATNLSVTKHHKTILEDCDFHIPSHTICACIGPNGAGKTTLIKTLIQEIIPTNGSINTSVPLYKVGYAPDSGGLYTHLTIKEQLQFWQKLTKKQTNIDNVLTHRGLDRQKDVRVTNLSHGMKQRLRLATSLLHDPDLIIRDEPMNGLDPIGRKIVLDTIHTQQQQGKTIFFTTHLLHDVSDIAQHIIMLQHGHIVATQQIDKQHKDALEKLFFASSVQHHH